MDVRQVVKERMRERRLRTADLARLLAGRIKQRTLYAFLQGDPLNAESLGHVLDALQLGIYPQEWFEQRVSEEERQRAQATAQSEAEAPARRLAELRQELERLLAELEVRRVAHLKAERARRPDGSTAMFLATADLVERVQKEIDQLQGRRRGRPGRVSKPYLPPRGDS